MVKKILAILVILYLGIVIIPNAMNAIGDSGELTVYFYSGSAPDVVIWNISDVGYTSQFGGTLNIWNDTTSQTRYIIALGNFDNTDEIYKLEFNLWIQSVISSGNISVHKLIGTEARLMVHYETNWTNTRNLGYWTNPGGDYNQTPLDTEYITGSGYTTFNITYYLNDSYDNQRGLIFIAEQGANFTIFSGLKTPIYKIYYKSGSGLETALEADIWNLEGFSNATSKLASVIFSEISNCKALVYKNATSGYYYTYAPTWGMLEDEYLQYGDGLFILTTADTTWDHT